MGRKDDPFCEETFFLQWWLGSDAEKKLTVKNPFSVATGFVMFLAPLLLTNVYFADEARCGSRKRRNVPLALIFAKAGLSLTGLGTMYFHAVHEYEAMHVFHVDFEMSDWVPIVLMCGYIMGMYSMLVLKKQQKGFFCLWQSERFISLLFFCVMLWIFVLIVGLERVTRTFFREQVTSEYGSIMNGVLLLPLALMLFYCSVTEFAWQESKLLWYSILVSLVMWLLNNYFCEKFLWLFILHPAYHLTIAYAFLYAACLGLTLDVDSKNHKKKWALVLRLSFFRRGAFWPMIMDREDFLEAISDSASLIPRLQF